MAGRRSTILLLLGMLTWVAVAFAGAIVAAAVLGLGAGVLSAVTHNRIGLPGPMVYFLVGASGFQGVLLWGGLRQGRRAANGDWRAGLGLRPIRHGQRVLLICALILGWLMLFLVLMSIFPALRAFAKSVTPELLLSGHDSVTIIVSRVILVAILAPLSEELFFRGWLWEALRRRGHAPFITACLTVVPWLLLHGIDSPLRVVMLLPAALAFSAARVVGDSVRASLAVHMTNNGAAAVFQTLASVFGHDT